jgi:hypothetical protein
MSMFDLPTQVSELSGANSGMSNKRFVEVNCSRAVTDSTFANSLQEFKFNVSGTTWWIPKESFFRIRMAITRNDGSPIQLQDDIAPSYSVCDTLFRSLEFKMGGISVSRIGQYCPQIAGLKKRQEYSTQWRNDLGQSIGMYDTRFIERQNYISVDGTSGREYNQSLSYFGGVVPGVHVDEKSELKAGTVELKSATSLLVVGSFRINDLISFGTGPTNQILEIVGINADTTASQTYSVRGVNSAIVPVNTGGNPGAMNTPAFTIARLRSSEPPTARIGDFEFMWQPCLSIFDSDKALPVGSYSFILQPENRAAIEKTIVQSAKGNKTAGTDYKVDISDIKLYVSTVESSRVDDLDYYIDLKEMDCAVGKIQSASWSQYQFIVNPSLVNVSIAFQDTRVGSDTRIPATLFKVGTSANVSDFQQNQLSRFNFSYAGIQYPAQDTDQKFNAGVLGTTTGRDYTTQIYLSSMLANGGFYTDSGTEGIQDFRSAGMYLSYNVPKDGNDRSTDLVVRVAFDTTIPTDITQMNLLMFQTYRKFCAVKVRGGQVISVNSQYN